MNQKKTIMDDLQRLLEATLKTTKITRSSINSIRLEIPQLGRKSKRMILTLKEED